MYVAIRDEMLRHVNAEDGFAALQALGLNAVELAVADDLKVPHFPCPDNQPFDLSTDAGRSRARTELKAKGVSVCALLMANDFSSPNLEVQKRWLVDTMAVAADVGAASVRIDLLPHSQEMGEQPFMERCIESITAALADGAQNVELAIENHGKTTNRQEFLSQVLDSVGSPRLGVTLDTGNFYWYGCPLDEVYEIIERFSAAVKHTHVKNINYPSEKRNIRREVGWEYGAHVSPIYEGDVDHRRIVSILRKAGYDGDLTVEDESLGRFSEEERAGILRTDVDHLKRLL